MTKIFALLRFALLMRSCLIIFEIPLINIGFMRQPIFFFPKIYIWRLVIFTFISNGLVRMNFFKDMC